MKWARRLDRRAKKISKFPAGHHHRNDATRQIADGRLPRSNGRVAHNYKNDKKSSTFHIYFYAINKMAPHGAASLWRNGYEPNKQASYAVHDGTESRLAACNSFF